MPLSMCFAPFYVNSSNPFHKLHFVLINMFWVLFYDSTRSTVLVLSIGHLHTTPNTPMPEPPAGSLVWSDPDHLKISSQLS